MTTTPRAFIAATILGLGLVSTGAQASNLALDSAGNLFAGKEHSIVQYAPNGTKRIFAERLRYPLGLCFDHNGNLFVSDGAVPDARNQRAIFKFAPDGSKSVFATGISSGGMACDGSGNLFVSQGESVFKFTPDGAKSTAVTSELANFIGLAFDRSGNLFVADQAIANNGAGRSILKVSADETRTVFADGLDDPHGLTADSAGNIYVVQVAAGDSTRRVILKFRADGTKTTFATGLERTDGLCADDKGNLFAWDGRSILKFDSTGSPITFTSDRVSPDKQWEYKCAKYGPGQCAPEIVKAGSTEVAVDLDQDLSVYGPDADKTDVVWAPDSKRFACNYSPVHAHHTTYVTVAFYQLKDAGWMQLASPIEAKDQSQLVELARRHLLKEFNPKACAPEGDVLKVRAWTDANTAILFAPCHRRTSGKLAAGFLFTLKFDANGNSKIVNTQRLSKKELEEEE